MELPPKPRNLGGRPQGKKNPVANISAIARHYLRGELNRATLEEVIWDFARYLFPFSSGDKERLLALKKWIKSRPNHRNPLE